MSMVELLIVICIISVLMALLLPAIQQSRVAARNVQDANRMRQMGLAIHQHAELFGRLPVPGTENSGIDEGWSLAVLSGTAEGNQLAAFDRSSPLDATINLKVASQKRPDVFASDIDHQSHEPWDIAPLDDATSKIPVLPSAYAFNGFIHNSRLEHLSTSQTAMLCRFGTCGTWVNSPEFWSLDISADSIGQSTLLVGFADGSVKRLTAVSDVIVDPEHLPNGPSTTP